MKDLIAYMVRNLVDHPDSVEIHEVAGDKAEVYEVKVRPEDLGKVIGKHGRTIRSVRTLVAAAANRSGKRVMVEVVE
jgi:predicted RNA-binding protein YlqC (UPF0109 family)